MILILYIKDFQLAQLFSNRFIITVEVRLKAMKKDGNQYELRKIR